MEKVKERVITGMGVCLVYLLFIGALWLLNLRVDYIEELASANVPVTTVNK